MKIVREGRLHFEVQDGGAAWIGELEGIPSQESSKERQTRWNRGEFHNDEYGLFVRILSSEHERLAVSGKMQAEFHSEAKALKDKRIRITIEVLSR